LPTVSKDSPGGAALAAMVRDARALPALLHHEAEGVKISAHALEPFISVWLLASFGGPGLPNSEPFPKASPAGVRSFWQNYFEFHE
jgi:hypothetical protein